MGSYVHVYTDGGGIKESRIPDDYDFNYEVGKFSTITLSTNYPGGIVAHARAAAVELKTTGGVIQFPAGTHEVENLPIFPGITYRGVGIGNKQFGGSISVTRLVLPAAPAHHMFVARTSAQDAIYGSSNNSLLSGFCVENMQLDGLQDRESLSATVGYDCINVDSLNSLTGAEIVQCSFRGIMAYGFRCFYRNNCTLANCRDRSPSFNSVYISECWAGIWSNEHPYFTGYSTFRLCTYAITGSALYDMNIAGLTIAYCDFGIVPQGTASIGRSNIANCLIAYNGVGIRFNAGSQNNIVSACIFAPHSTPAASCAISIAGVAGPNVALITGNTFDEEGGASKYTNAAILLDNSSQYVHNFSILGNTFVVNGSKAIGVSGTGDIGRCQIQNNKFHLAGNPAQVIDTGLSGIIYMSFQNNTVRATANAGNGVAIDMDKTFSAGILFQNNSLACDATGYVDKFASLAASRGIVTGNLSRNATNGITIVEVDATSLPVGIIAGTSSVATDSANLKGTNIIA